MIFTITRTSDTSQKPCEEAMPYEIKFVEKRKFRTPEEFDKLFGYRDGKWLDIGTNHRIINGYIARDRGTKTVWAIEINSLEELITFHRKYGELVIDTEIWDCETPSIEIYDDWRE